MYFYRMTGWNLRFNKYVCFITMETKLTIRLKKKVIEQAKAYSFNHKISLSKIIEGYLESITSQGKEDIEITPLVESLSGVIRLNDNLDLKNEYVNHLAEKYK